MITIKTDNVTLDRTIRRSTVAIGHGFDAMTGEEVTFSADFASMAPVTHAMARGETVDCKVEPWQVLTRIRMGDEPVRIVIAPVTPAKVFVSHRRIRDLWSGTLSREVPPEAWQPPLETCKWSGIVGSNEAERFI